MLFVAAAPHLYTKNTVSDLVAFFRGIDEFDFATFENIDRQRGEGEPTQLSSDSAKPGCLNKSMNSTLCVVLSGVSWNLARFWRRASGEIWVVQEERADYRSSFARREVRMDDEAGEMLTHPSGVHNPLPNPRCITLGLQGSNHGTDIAQYTDQVGDVGRLITWREGRHPSTALLIDRSPPKHWCQHISFGPLACLTAMVFRFTNPPVTFTSHLN